MIFYTYNNNYVISKYYYRYKNIVSAEGKQNDNHKNHFFINIHHYNKWFYVEINKLIDWFIILWVKNFIICKILKDKNLFLIKHLVKGQQPQQNQKGLVKYLYRLLISKINLKLIFLDKLHVLMLLNIITACQLKNIEM